MGLLCALGLAACITIGGKSYPEDDALSASYECRMARAAGYYPDFSFILVDGRFRPGRQQGYITLEILEDYGVDFRWKPRGRTPDQRVLARFRKDQLREACRPFLSF